MKSEIKVFEDKTLNDQSFILDEVVFIRCRLKNCDLFYCGVSIGAEPQRIALRCSNSCS